MIGHKDKERISLRRSDIQGNILNAYGKLGFPKGRAILLHVNDPIEGRKFIKDFYPQVTTALRWKSKRDYAPEPDPHAPKRPSVTLNFAFTFSGLVTLGVPIRTLSQMPSEFMQGMRARAPILGDTYPTDALKNWDKVWLHEAETDGPNNVHILALLNSEMDPKTGEPVSAMDHLTDDIRQHCLKSDGAIKILKGHGVGPDEYQDMSAILHQNEETELFETLPLEHFGFVDGISDPVFEGQFQPKDEDARKVGNGKFSGAISGDLMDKDNWEPLAAGEFLLGYPDEAKELPPAARPSAFSVNGTFMAYRKLEEKVEDFEDYIDDTVLEFAKVYGIEDELEARSTLMAKFSGRWQDGVPLMLAPTYADWVEFNESHKDPLLRYRKLSQFTYATDPHGSACPASSHMRRVHPRDALGPDPAIEEGKLGTSGTTLVNRRRILRRGLPYDSTNEEGERERGIVMLVCCASLERQFEFVQQQWLNYGMDANSGNDTCPMLGIRPSEDVKFVIPNDPAGEGGPYFCSNMPQFVETKGGAYFFVPSMTCLRMISIGVIDPT